VHAFASLHAVPLGATPHWPFAPQAWHVPLHGELQHTPFTQLPSAHWLEVEQAVPTGNFATQTLLAQKSPGEAQRDASKFVQVVKHALVAPSQARPFPHWAELVQHVAPAASQQTPSRT
jgi:hypothetical protein